MDNIQNLSENTELLRKAVGIMQGTRWDGTTTEARQYLVGMDMDLAFALGLVADMDGENFAQAVTRLAGGERVTTRHKSIAIWVRKFGFTATLASSGDLWEIGHSFAVNDGTVTSCGTCKFWKDGLCDCSDSEFCMAGRVDSDFACPEYAYRRHMNRWGCGAVVALIVAVMVFLGAWFFTGNIWAAIYLFEVIFDILMELVDIF